ncbi:hypothetical protein A3A39_00900 [Candidatus Kaiserbacteria bacterium RIFCSPLOWO2_01_FULL_54_13]|uniref:Uncharacterized protein n=1 Tax=Candidatus Kaiserbacteria bacterium RIFCSPLOWO2_01_FULL_54_13 TaxID=1798512 RepID=A0A1F6F1T0_9BACT|nr:MAG: hypothetical protein A3A39_00900 [Candidatus Kaiserbacteria bacterium RIFCSPLOWO2_01_FULL_54_13]
MTDYHVVLGGLAVVIGLVSYVPYFRDIVRGATKPHPFSWFVWGFVSGIAFLAQIVKDGGPGAWATGITSIACFVIAAFAFFRGERGITKFDWVCFIGAMAGIVFWRITNEPLSAVIIVTIVDGLGFAPTFRKAYLKPYEETLSTYVLSLLKWGLGLIALTSVNLTTILFPGAIFVMNLGFVVMVLIRRRQLSSV